MQNKEEAAEELLHDILDQTPELVAAYDLLADVRITKKDPEGAQAALKQGVQISGKTVRRQQKLGELAVENGDLATAREAFTAVLEKGQHSVFVTPADFGNLCRVQVDQGDPAAALETLKRSKAVLQVSPEGRLVNAVVRQQVRVGLAAPVTRLLRQLQP